MGVLVSHEPIERIFLLIRGFKVMDSTAGRPTGRDGLTSVRNNANMVVG